MSYLTHGTRRRRRGGGSGGGWLIAAIVLSVLVWTSIGFAVYLLVDTHP